MPRRPPQARQNIEEYSKAEINKRNKDVVVDELISEHNNAFETQNVKHDKMKLALIANYLEGSPIYSLLKYKNEENHSWEGFARILKEQFEDSNLDFREVNFSI